MFDLTTIEFILLGIIIFFAFLIRSLAGFGAALISIPLLVLFIDVKTVVPFQAVLLILTSSISLFKCYKQVHWKALIPVIIGAVLGNLLGVYLLGNFDNTVTRKMLGITILLFSFDLLVKKEFRKQFPNYFGYIAGILGGILGGIFGTNGPPFVIYLANKIKDKVSLRATLVGLITVDASARVIMYSASGFLDQKVLQLSLAMMPLVFIATYIGEKVQLRVTQNQYKLLVVSLLMISGITLLIK